MANVSSVTKHFITGQEGFTTTLASTISSGAATVPLNSVSGYTNGEQVAFVIEPTDDDKKQVFTGTIDTSGVQVTGVVWTEGTNQTHNAGVTVVDYWTATHQAALVKGTLVDHSQTGAHEITANYDPSNPTLETQKWAGVASAVNEITITNAATGNAPVIESSGGDTNINLSVKPKGSTGIVQILDHNSNEVVKAGVGTASAVNEVTVTNAATGNAPTISATGGDTNIDLALIGKGTGTVDLPTNFKGKVHYRQGGSSTVWGTGGTSNYDTSDEKVIIQCGTSLGSAASDVTVTFPTAFTYAPVLVATIVSAGGFNTFVVTNSVTTSSFVFRCLDTTNTRRAETISWTAIGV